MINKIIRNFVAKQVAGRSDDGIMITLRDPQKVEFQTAMMQELLMRRGIDPMAIQSEAQLNMIINRIKAMEKAEEAAQSGIRNTESAKVFNRAGEELDPNQPIIGGTQPGKSIDTDTFVRLADTNTQRMKQKIADRKIESDQPPPGSRGGDEDIAAPVQSKEETLRNMTEAEIKANLEAQNKKGIENILKRKNREDVYGLEDYDTTNMSEIKKEIIRTETKLGNLNPDDPNFRAKAKPLVDKITALQKKLREDKADGGRIGYFMGSPNPLGTATIREMLKFFSKGSSTGKTGSEMLQLTNPKSLNKLLMDPEIYRKFDIKKGIAAPELIKSMQSQMTSERKKMLEEILGAAKNIQKSDESTIKYKNEMIDEMIAKGVDRNMAEDMAGMLSRMAENVAGKRDTPKLSKEGILQLETILKNMETGNKPNRKLNADGGRIGFKDGPGMTRRTFLKILGGAVSIPIIGKFFKPMKVGKTVTKVPIIQTDNVAGKPEWFDQLVNKVILEGDEVTKNFATKDREIVHMKKLDKDNNVIVYQDLDEGAVRVEYQSKDNMFGEQVDLRYRKPNPDEGDPRPVAEFDVEETGVVGRSRGPDDYELEVEGVGGSSISDLESDLTKLKTYATGQKPTIKELSDSMKRKQNVKRYEEGDGQMDYVIKRQGEYDGPDGYDDYASGGIARLLGE